MQTDASQVFEAEAAKEAMDLVAAANGSFSLAPKKGGQLGVHGVTFSDGESRLIQGLT
jgi:hypothetical protein